MVHAANVALGVRARLTEAASSSAATVRRHPVAVLGFIALAALAISPIWRARFLPLLDEPAHVSSVYIYRYLRDPASDLATYYARSFRFVPYLLYHAVLYVLSLPLPLELANKLLQSAYVLSFPLAAWLWLRRTGRNPTLAVLAIPLAYSYTWAHGFQPFNIGVPVMLFGIIALDAWLARPTVVRALLLLVLSMAAELAHPLVFAGLGLGCAALSLVYLTRPLRVLSAALFFVPSLVALKLQVSHSAATPFATEVAMPGAKLIDGTWVGWAEMLQNLPAYTADVVTGDVDLAVFFVMVAVSVGLLLTGLPARVHVLHAPRGLHHYRGALVAAALLVAYFALPLHLSRPFDWWFVSGRFAVPFCFFALLLPSGAMVGARRNLRAAATLAAAVLMVVIGNRYADFDRRMQPMVLLQKLAPRQDTLLLLTMHPRTDPAVNVEAYRQISAWMQLLRGGFTPSGFFQTEHPFRVVHALPCPLWYWHEGFDFVHHGEPWAWVMIHGAAPGSIHVAYDLVAREGPFSLYRRMQP
jgi:hypothetical protein